MATTLILSVRRAAKDVIEVPLADHAETLSALMIFCPLRCCLLRWSYASLLTRSRNALAMTETELKLMAAAAIIGLSRRWGEIGYNTPAAMGTPRAL